jgi:hypothetical protein
MLTEAIVAIMKNHLLQLPRVPLLHLIPLLRLLFVIPQVECKANYGVRLMVHFIVKKPS